MIERKEMADLAQMSEKMAGKQPVRPPKEVVVQPLEMNALAEMLADPNISPGPETTEMIRRLAAGNDAGNKPNGHTGHTGDTGDTVEERKMNARAFLSRDYHAHRANRFLFSCADEPDGYANNKASGWLYTLPETPVPYSSDSKN